MEEKTEHPCYCSLVAYVAGRASEHDAMLCEEHMAGCQECLDQVRGLMHLKENFEEMWENFTPENMGKAIREIKQ